MLVQVFDDDLMVERELLDIFYIDIHNTTKIGVAISNNFTGFYNLSYIGLSYEVGTNDSSLLDPCRINPCGIGMCTRNSSDFTCLCPNGYLGNFCEVTDHCFGINCSNRGECMNRDNFSLCDCDTGYVCTCLPGFTGNDCELEDYCYISDMNCSDNTVCVNGLILRMLSWISWRILQ